MNVLADITVGDPWGISQQDGTDGESVAVVRTEVGREVFQSMLEHGAAVGRPITYRQVLAGQKVEKKRLEWRGYVEAWKDFGYPVPNFSERLKGSTPPRPSGMRFRAHLQQSLSLDQHPSRAEVLAAVQKNLLLQDIKRRVTWPLMVMKRVLGKMTGRLVRKAH